MKKARHARAIASHRAPRELLAARGAGSDPVLTTCCRLEKEIEQAGLVVVPWGATLGHVGQGLRQRSWRW